MNAEFLQQAICDSACKIMRAKMLLPLLLLSAGCGESQPGNADPNRLTATSLGTQTVLTSEQFRAMPEYSDVNLELGERLSYQCRACHTFENGGPHLIGPNLHRFFGRQAGALQNFPYSAALSASTFTWTPRALDAWLASPRDFLPGNSMVYAGLASADDRQALIGYLLSATE